MFEFTDILLTAALPLHPSLAAHPRLSVAVIEGEEVCVETPAANGDLATGIWQINSSISANSVKHSVTLALVASENGARIRLASVTFSVAELLTRIEAQPDEHQEFAIGDSISSIEILMNCMVKAAPSFVMDNMCSQDLTRGDDPADIHSRYQQSDSESEPSELFSRDDAESLYAKAIQMPNEGVKARVLSQLGCAYHAHYQETRLKADLERAISMHEEAMQFTRPFHPQLAEHIHGLAAALEERFEQSGDRIDIERAISRHQTALEATEVLDAVKPHRLISLGIALILRFEHFGDLSDLESAIVFIQEAVQLTPHGHSDETGGLDSLGNALQTRFERLGSVADLKDAISKMRQAVELTSDGHPSRAMRLNNLGNALQIRFEHLGSLADLEDAIWNKRKAVELTPDGHPSRAMRLSNLGNALQIRFERLGSLADLEGAISNARKAVELTPNGHPEKPRWLNNLGHALQIRFDCLGSVADLEDAISNHRTAVEQTPDGHPGKAARFSGLGNALQSRFERLSSVADLDDAILNKQRAIGLTPNGLPGREILFSNLGDAFRIRFKCLGSLTDLEDAISNERKAIELAPNGHPVRVNLFSNLGDALLLRFDRLGILSDLDSGLSALSTATNSISGSAMTRFKAARHWAKVAEDHSRSPLDAFRCAIDFLPRIAWLGLAVADQHALLADVGGIVRDAVAAAIRYKEYETAVVWAEQGRSIVWQNLLGFRSPVDELRRTYPELANRLRSIARQLEESGSHNSVRGNKQTVPVEDVSRRYSKLALEWDNLVDEIRSLPTFEGFLKAKTFTQLSPAAYEGPVVILNVNDARCDALVLIADDSVERNVSAVNMPLERFSHEKSKNMFQNLTDLLSSAGVRDRNERKTGRAQSWAGSDAKFKGILHVLWQDIVKPVIEGLAFQTETKRPPRVWWCATGLLAFLPIHAAGLYDTHEIGQKVSEYVVSSYTPTLTAILELSDPVVREDFQVLTVAQASAPGAPPIPKTEEEVKIVQNLVDSARVLNLAKEKATVQRQNSDNPMESGFLLHDRMLKLSEIVRMSLPKADFAFLSACQTAMGDEKVAEESVHLAAGMLLSGCRGVIATTWSIRDKDAPRIAQEVYSRMFKDGKPNRKEAAYALHEAVKLLRESGAPCTAWVPFIHIGR